MPFTPFHFGLHATIALPLRRYLDLPVFILASVVVDLEPLAVMVLNLNYQLHGYCHTFLIGGMVGLFWGGIAARTGALLNKIMKAFRLEHEPNVRRALISGVLGVWLHILLDAPIYDDIRPFWPIKANPLFWIISDNTAYRFAIVMFLPALVLYWIALRKERDATSGADAR